MKLKLKNKKGKEWREGGPLASVPQALTPHPGGKLESRLLSSRRPRPEQGVFLTVATWSQEALTAPQRDQRLRGAERPAVSPQWPSRDSGHL